VDPQGWHIVTFCSCETTNNVMRYNLDVVRSCLDYIIGSWAVTAVYEVVTCGASAGVAYHGSSGLSHAYGLSDGN
jgi:hypothetical protein